MTSIRHHVVITKDGDIETLDKEHTPSDVHFCIGQRLPEELNMYLSRGMLRSRVLNWLTSGTILVTAPFDGGDSIEYQTLVKTQLEPMRRQALSLLADSVNRYYQRKEITTRLWFDQEYEAKFNIKDLLPSPKDSLSRWNVKGSMIVEQRRKLKVRRTTIDFGLFILLITPLGHLRKLATRVPLLCDSKFRWSNIRFEDHNAKIGGYGQGRVTRNNYMSWCSRSIVIKNPTRDCCERCLAVPSAPWLRRQPASTHVMGKGVRDHPLGLWVKQRSRRGGLPCRRVNAIGAANSWYDVSRLLRSTDERIR